MVVGGGGALTFDTTVAGGTKNPSRFPPWSRTELGAGAGADGEEDAGDKPGEAQTDAVWSSRTGQPGAREAGGRREFGDAMGENSGRPATGGFEGEEGLKRIEDGWLRGLAASARAQWASVAWPTHLTGRQMKVPGPPWD
ncbi:hypothetical protein QQX98_011716 [Neonectria punicea]|uniref:Uncharacterized protein n=1 Tax=Neonectria punicea TaxID=979145 RepID=A0ABR1GLC7_9HYPO